VRAATTSAGLGDRARRTEQQSGIQPAADCVEMTIVAHRFFRSPTASTVPSSRWLKNEAVNSIMHEIESYASRVIAVRLSQWYV